MNRRKAREYAFCILFAREFQPDVPAEDFYSSATENLEIDGDEYIHKVFFGVEENLEKIDEKISKYAIGWKNDRLSKVSLAALRLCIYEMQNLDDVPAAVAINEALEICKKFDYDSAHTFVNGILNAIYKESEGK